MQTAKTTILSIREKLAGLVAPQVIERRDELERLVNTDALTGLANRRAFDLAEPRARAEKMAFIIFDANNFGLVNKRISHETGDEILCRFADVIANASQNYKARAFRLGGDEFVVIAPRAFAFRVRDAIERRARPVDFPGFTVSLSGVVGHSVKDADKRLQSRKAQAKQGVV